VFATSFRPGIRSVTESMSRSCALGLFERNKLAPANNIRSKGGIARNAP